MNVIDRMRMFVVLVVSMLPLAACGSQEALPRAELSAVAAASGNSAAGFARVTEPRPFVFPRDHGAHPEYATEWWYYTGNLDTADGRHFGFQLTFFRSALAPERPDRPSDWATASIYMAHFALADVAGERFFAFDRFSRGAAGLAGAAGEPQFRVWLDDWSAEGQGPEGLPMRLRAAQGQVAIDLALDPLRPVVLQGEAGLSQKGATPGNASYYYSYTRMATEGVVTIDGQQFEVSGLSWMDHEFGTSALEAGAVGWDWFALQLDDGRDIMYAQVRNADGSAGYVFGTLVEPDGTYRSLDPVAMSLEVTDSWQSPRSGAEYPSGWRLRIPAEQLDLRMTPLLRDQELPLAVVYWEGAVRVTGDDLSGYGYVELTGYGERSDAAVQVR